MNKLNVVLARARFNPVYSAVLTEWMALIPSKGILVSVKAGLAKATVNQLRSFNGLDAPKPGAKAVKPVKVVSQLNPLTKAKKQIVGSMGAVLDRATLPLLGEPISGFLIQTESLLAQIKSIQ